MIDALLVSRQASVVARDSRWTRRRKVIAAVAGLLHR